LAEADFFHRNNRGTVAGDIALDLLCCRFNFIARQHWIYDEGDFVMSHYQSVVKKYMNFLKKRLQK
jgi:hypothetical protein